jgi:glutamate dehydrogenase
MKKTIKEGDLSPQLEQAIQTETEKFKEYYLWLEKAMPPLFFEEVSTENIMLITHNLMGFPLQGYFSTIHLERAALVLCLNSPDADLRVLKDYEMYGIKTYQAYVSSTPAPFPGIPSQLRITQIFFTELIECVETPFPVEAKEELRALVKQRNPDVSDNEFDSLINSMNVRFLRSMKIDRLILALDMFFRAKTRDNCQYEARYNEDWETKDTPSLQIVLAWKNTPKHNFLYRMARIIYRNNLMMKRVNATYVEPYSKDSILVMSIGLHGINGEAAWDIAHINDFLRELATLKYFASFDKIDNLLIRTLAIPSKYGNFLRAMINFIHQNLVQLNPNLYTVEKIEEDLCRHPELTYLICEAFQYKFDPDHYIEEKYLDIREKFLIDINNLDTGHPENDERRKNVLKQGMNLVHFTLKTNYFRLNYTAICFRLDPKYLDDIPFDRKTKFPELPYGIFFFKGMHFFGYHIRFKDLARGGLRTVYPKLQEHIVSEADNVFSECYHLASTQQQKNKDIPEGGAKGIIFLRPFDRLESEAMILQKELEEINYPEDQIFQKMEDFRKEQTEEFLYQAQRAYVESLITLINCEPDGKIRAKHIIDYWKRPEYLYLGPDENMHDPMIQWIANFSKKYGYKPGSSFISGKPLYGINHKHYGVTSLGVNVYMEALLKHIGINPAKDTFTVKMSGGPDGDVAGNQICNLYRYYPKTAKLIALTDISGTIYDPEGLDLEMLVELFKQVLPISHYPPDKLHDGGFLVDRTKRRQQTAYAQQTLCWKKQQGKLIQDWLSGSDMNHLYRHNVHEKVADIFIPGGGRPRTLDIHNVKEFLTDTGIPTAKGIVEGANLYLTPKARRFLEEKGCLIIKDSSANKTGVICSSFEVLCGLTLGDDLFLKEKETLVKEILERLKTCASNEAQLMLRTLKEEGGYLTSISDRISERINQFTYQLLDHLESSPLSSDRNDPLIKFFLNYSLKTLVNRYEKELLTNIPDHHKKAIIASHLAAELVYKKGLNWLPSIVDVYTSYFKNG